MTNFNLIGKVYEKPTVEVAKNGNSYARVKVAVDKPLTDNEKDIFEIYVWNSLTEEAYEKDHLICIAGKVVPNNFMKDGNTYYNCRLVAEKIDFYN